MLNYKLVNKMDTFVLSLINNLNYKNDWLVKCIIVFSIIGFMPIVLCKENESSWWWDTPNSIEPSEANSSTTTVTVPLMKQYDSVTSLVNEAIPIQGWECHCWNSTDGSEV